MKRILLLIFLVPVMVATGQTVSPESANEKFTFGDYEGALEDYLILLKDNPDNSRYLFRTAVCYLNSNLDKTASIPYLEKLLEEQPVKDINTYYLLGRAYHFAHRFDDAIRMLNFYKDSEKGLNPIPDFEKQIEYNYNAKELIKYPLDVTFENLGAEVNSPYPDYYPFVPQDEKFILYNSQRDDGSAERLDGKFTSNVYLSREKDGKFQPGDEIGSPVNSRNGDEEVVGLSHDGRLILYYFQNAVGEGDLYMGGWNDKGGFKKPESLPKVVNSKDVEIAASITVDGEAIYFASNRSGGYGGVDIYVSRKLPNGKWSPAQNLGPQINTEFDEDFPNISAEGNKLYFSSKGHTSMGGYDIFESVFNPETRKWGSVRNMGYPINSTMDDMNLRMSETGRHGYMSALRKGGIGDYDIYRVRFNRVEPKNIVLKGDVKSSDTTQVAENISISVFDNDTDEFFGEYLPNPNTGRYIIILPPGSFSISIESEGFEPVSRQVNVSDISTVEFEQDFSVLLHPKKPTE